MYDKILVPVDGSEASLLGLQEAIRLAKNQQARLRLLHVVHDFPVASGRHGLTCSDESRSAFLPTPRNHLNNCMRCL
jgi:nucleotide-binding universal stress UspA family protein